MAFGIGVSTQESNAGEVKGRQHDIACKCWFDSTGKIIPLLIKVKDEDGEIRIIRRIQVLSQEKKNYAGIPSIEFDCNIDFLDFRYRASLIYYLTENRWVLNFRQGQGIDNRPEPDYSAI